MHATEIRVLSGSGEAELEFLVGVERGRLELVLRTVDGVRDVVAVDPGQVRAGFYRDVSGDN